MTKPVVFFATPYRLPEPSELGEAVVVLDLAFCANGPQRSYEQVTFPFIETLGPRLKLWIDHHDHERNADWVNDPRFVLVSREQHPACPELVTPERVLEYELLKEESEENRGRPRRWSCNLFRLQSVQRARLVKRADVP